MKKSALKSQSLLAFIVVTLIVTASSFALLQTAEWNAPESSKTVKNPIPSDSASIAAGKIVYSKECLSCHGKKGLGDGPNAITLDKSPEPLNIAKVKAQTDGELFWKIKEGKKPMPSTKTTLNDEQRWKVINYIRTFTKK